MEYLIKIIEQGSTIAGDQKQLEAKLGLARGNISDVKAGRRGLPTDACFKLADMTGADLARVIASSEAITAKKPEEVKYWKKKLNEFERLAAVYLLALTVGVISFVTPSPAKAAPILQMTDFTVYIMSNNISHSRPAF